MKELFKENTKIVYSHKKGGIYTAIGSVKFQLGDENEISRNYVMYISEDGRKFIREINEFHDGRFTKVRDDSTSVSVAEIGRVVMRDGHYGFGDPPILHYTGFDIIDATNANCDRKVCLAWKDFGPVFVMEECTLADALNKNLYTKLVAEELVDAAVDAVCICHKLGEHYYKEGCESIMPLCCIVHATAPDAYIKDNIKLYNFCPNCGKELAVDRVTVKSGDRFMSVFWDENLTEG